MIRAFGAHCHHQTLAQVDFLRVPRQNWLSNRVFKSYDDIVDHCCYGWNTLIDQPWKIMSIARREWATIGSHCED